MPRPPDDWESELIQQLGDVLDRLDADVDDATLDAVLGGVRDALGLVGDAGKPPVVVIEGGRSDHEDDDDDDVHPDLHVVPPPADDDDDDDSRIHVFEMSDLPRVFGQARRGATGGRIEVDRDTWQTVFRGNKHRCYRIFARSGELRIALDGALADVVHSGQSIDAEARLIRVTTPDDQATGRYERVR